MVNKEVLKHIFKNRVCSYVTFTKKLSKDNSHFMNVVMHLELSDNNKIKGIYFTKEIHKNDEENIYLFKGFNLKAFKSLNAILHFCNKSTFNIVKNRLF